MMGAHKLSAGNGYTYLTRQTAANDSNPIPAGGLGAYYAERGEAPGQWVGTGLVGLGMTPGDPVSEAQMVSLFGEGRHPDSAAISEDLFVQGAGIEVIDAATALGMPFALNPAGNTFQRQVAQLIGEWNEAQGLSACASAPVWVRSRIRSAVGSAMFAQAFGREPRDARELADFVASSTRLASRAVAGFDLTFSPVKSVSALWAISKPEVARQIEAAHAAAVGNTMEWLEREAAFTRLGKDGIRQVEVRGLIAASFVHRTSRAGDPDLHTHVAVSNKVQTADGLWRALDGRVLLKAAVAASERYNTRLEAELRHRLGVRFEERPGGRDRRPVREIAGLDPRLLTLWSSRRRDIDRVRAELSRRFEAEHGRPPTPAEAIEIAQQATLRTRPAKHEPESEADQRAAWRVEATGVIGDVDLAATGAVGHAVVTTRVDAHAMAATVIERVQQDRAAWQRWHVLAETHRQLRGNDVPLDRLDATGEQVTRLALEEQSVALHRPDVVAEPAALRRSTGDSVYTVAGSQLYTSLAVLAAEQSLLSAAARTDGVRITPASVDLALLEVAANGPQLNDGQVAFVRALAASGARCQVGLAPAGTGKTTALRALAAAWREDGGLVIPLAPSAAAAWVLGDATGSPADTIAKFLHDLGTADEPAVQRGTLVVVDEAGLASSADLARLVAYVTDHGGDVRLVGDDRQLAAIGAGGVLRDIAETVGATRLDETVRFGDAAEAKATLGIRVGNAAALAFYLDHDRVRVGDEHTAAESAYRAWAADRAAGRDSLLLAATREQLTALNSRARADRLAATGGLPGPEVRLGDGTFASAGDVITTRRNDRRLAITATDWVKNGDQWTVAHVERDGTILARHYDSGRTVTIPAGYVREDVTLGYASTIHGAQGRTADTCHTVLTGRETREQLYVALTRGRDGNHMHLALPGASDEHAATRRDTLRPPSSVELLKRILDRDDAARSATTEQRELLDPIRRLRHAVAAYVDAVHDNAPANTEAGIAPLPWLPRLPDGARPEARQYLEARAGLVADLADRVGTEALDRRGEDGTDPALVRDTAIWIAVHGSMQTSPDLRPQEAQYLDRLHQRLAAHRDETAAVGITSRFHEPTFDIDHGRDINL